MLEGSGIHLDERAREQLEPAGDSTAVYGGDRFELSGKQRVHNHREREKDNRGRDQRRLWPSPRSHRDGSGDCVYLQLTLGQTSTGR